MEFMRAAIAISVLFVIIMGTMLGCTSRQDAAGAAQIPEPLANETKLEEPEPYPLPSTLNLSFTRNVSDVINTDTVFFKKPEFDFSNITNGSGALIVYYFYTPHCSACAALRPEIERLKGVYQGVEWREYDITSQNGTYAYQDFANQSNLSQSQRMVPQVLVNGTVITDRFNINRTLGGIIAPFSAGQP
jgi:thiol-disulfide isomerase/thioredoxin